MSGVYAPSLRLCNKQPTFIVKTLVNPFQLVVDLCRKLFLDGFPQFGVDERVEFPRVSIPGPNSYSAQGTHKICVGHCTVETGQTVVMSARQGHRFNEDCPAYGTHDFVQCEIGINIIFGDFDNFTGPSRRHVLTANATNTKNAKARPQKTALPTQKPSADNCYNKTT